MSVDVFILDTRISNVSLFLLGTVPDRGGRANEMRPKALSSGGNSGRGGGGGGGGRGNHHNVGRGGGRNKSSDSNKRQQVDHGKQGGRESKVSKTAPVGVAAVVRADVSSDHS